MCWVSSQAVKQIAEEDIKVFKIGESHRGMFCSMYKDFKYQLNQLYTSHININIDGDIDIKFHDYPAYRFVGSRGFHSYDPSIVHLEISDNNAIPRWAVYARKRRLDFDTCGAIYVKAECVIPKGSAYYENDFGEIISNQIIIKNFEPIWN